MVSFEQQLAQLKASLPKFGGRKGFNPQAVGILTQIRTLELSRASLGELSGTLSASFAAAAAPPGRQPSVTRRVSINLIPFLQEQIKRKQAQGVSQAVTKTVTEQFATQEKKFINIFMEQEKRLEEKSQALLDNLRLPRFESESQVKQVEQSPTSLIPLAIIGAILLG